MRNNDPIAPRQLVHLTVKIVKTFSPLREKKTSISISELEDQKNYCTTIITDCDNNIQYNEKLLADKIASLGVKKKVAVITVEEMKRWRRCKKRVFFYS